MVLIIMTRTPAELQLFHSLHKRHYCELLRVAILMMPLQFSDHVFNFRCSPPKKKVVVTRKRQRKKTVMPSAHMRGNPSSVLALQRKPALDKKTVVKSRIQEILSGRSRFVIRKVVPTKGGADGATSGGQEGGGDPSFVSRHEEEVKRDRYIYPLIFPVDAIWHLSHLLVPLSHTKKGRDTVSTSPSCPILQARLHHC